MDKVELYRQVFISYKEMCAQGMQPSSFSSYFTNIQFAYKWNDYRKTETDICCQRVNAVGDVFISVFSRFSAQKYTQYRRKEKDCFALFAST